MKKFNPTTPTKRHHIDIDRTILSKKEPYKPLVKGYKPAQGRDSQGKISMRHKGGAVKKNYRLVEFGQIHKGIPAKIESIEYDPYRTAFIALVLFRNGARAYTIATAGLKAGDSIVCDDTAPFKIGNRVKLYSIPSGTQVHNVELRPEQGGKLARSAGSYLTMIGLEGNYAYLKMPSTEVRKVSKNCFATIGTTSNNEHNLINVGKAGRNRHKGIRPTVRGSAMNACDHPYGGGKGKHSRGTKRPKDKWGNVTGGRKTRKVNKYSNKFIVSRRKTKKTKK